MNCPVFLQPKLAATTNNSKGTLDTQLHTLNDISGNAMKLKESMKNSYSLRATKETNVTYGRNALFCD